MAMFHPDLWGWFAILQVISRTAKVGKQYQLRQVAHCITQEIIKDCVSWLPLPEFSSWYGTQSGHQAFKILLK